MRLLKKRAPLPGRPSNDIGYPRSPLPIDVSFGFSSDRRALVRSNAWRADTRAGARLVGDPRAAAYPDCGADRFGQDAGGVPQRPRRARPRRARVSPARPGARRVCLAAESAERRYPQEPVGAAAPASAASRASWVSSCRAMTAAVRTGDTTSSERAAMLRTPPHILVTTPESLYLLLTAERSREMLRTVRTVIVDEIHAVIGTRRGAHLALSLERLQQVADAAAAAHRPVGDAEADRGGGALPAIGADVAAATRRRLHCRSPSDRRRRPSPRDRSRHRRSRDRRSTR